MLHLSNIAKTHGGRVLFSDSGFVINPREKIGLVGPNGAGKTTIFSMIMGEQTPDEGTITLHGKLSIAYFSQNVGEMRGRTALDEVISGHTELAALHIELRQLEHEMTREDLSPEEMDKALSRLGDVQTAYEELGGYTMESDAAEILSSLGIAPFEHEKMVEDFSGGWKMRIALAKVLMVMPDLILMDEPTNYLDLETIVWLQKWLQRFKGAVLMTSHDREFMNQVVQKIVEVAHGRITTYSGNYEFYMRETAVRKQQNEAQVERQAAMLKKEEDFIARFKARASHASQVQSRVKKIEKIERVELLPEDEEISIYLPDIPRGGNDVAIVEKLEKVWVDTQGRRQEVFNNLSFTVCRQDKVAVVGVNGAGKSTLLKIIAGQLEPTSGTAELGAGIAMGYFSQHAMDVLDGGKTVFEALQARLPQHHEGTLRNILGAFLFRGEDIHKKIKFLSGGEKARVVLAIILSQKNNLLILDEPTNHLDITSRMVLLDALQRYEGTIMIVSHDRFFLHRLATKVLEVARGSTMLFPGTYKEYLEQRLGAGKLSCE